MNRKKGRGPYAIFPVNRRIVKPKITKPYPKSEFWKVSNVWIPCNAVSCRKVKFGVENSMKVGTFKVYPFSYPGVTICIQRTKNAWFSENEENHDSGLRKTRKVIAVNVIALKVYFMLCELFSPSQSPFFALSHPIRGPIQITFDSITDFRRFKERIVAAGRNEPRTTVPAKAEK